MSTNENTQDDLQARLAAHPVAKHIDLMLQEARAEERERIVEWLRAEAEIAEDVDTYNSVQAAAVMRYRADCIDHGEHMEAGA